MKKILFLLLLTVVFGACESDTDSNWNNRPGGNSDDTQNWDSYVITVKNWERINRVSMDICMIEVFEIQTVYLRSIFLIKGVLWYI